jgi:hypothetical protein
MAKKAAEGTPEVKVPTMDEYGFRKESKFSKIAALVVKQGSTLTRGETLAQIMALGDKVSKGGAATELFRVQSKLKTKGYNIALKPTVRVKKEKAAKPAKVK